jgi:hypothetical protein
MAYGGTIRFRDVLATSRQDARIKSGCLVDTSILFAGSYDLDQFNTPAVELFDYLGELEIPLFTNVNIRAEFLDLHRRVMIPEGMCSLLAAKGASLPLPIQAKLKSISTTAAAARASQKTFKPNSEAIGEWRNLLIEHSHQADGWQQFCTDFLQGKIEKIWDETCEALGINFLSLRDGDSSEWLAGQLTWDDMASIVGRFGIGSFDAMIINLFLNSKFAALITADREIAYVLNSMKPDGKFVVVPDRLRL